MVTCVRQKVQCQKIGKYYFKDPKGRIRKYLQLCRRKKCLTESSYNYENLCRICGEIVNNSHFDSEEHIKKFNISNLFQSKVNSLVPDIIIYTQTCILKDI